MNTSRIMQERTEELAIEERLSKEIYSLNYLKLGETVPFGVKVQLVSHAYNSKRGYSQRGFW